MNAGDNLTRLDGALIKLIGSQLVAHMLEEHLGLTFAHDVKNFLIDTPNNFIVDSRVFIVLGRTIEAAQGLEAYNCGIALHSQEINDAVVSGHQFNMGYIILVFVPFRLEGIESSIVRHISDGLSNIGGCNNVIEHSWSYVENFRDSMPGRIGFGVLDVFNIKNVVIILSRSHENVTSTMDETDCDIPIIGHDHLIVVDRSVDESVLNFLTEGYQSDVLCIQ